MEHLRDKLRIKLRRRIRDIGPLSATPTEGAFSDPELNDILDDALLLQKHSEIQDGIDAASDYSWHNIPETREPLVVLLAWIECSYILSTDSAKWSALSVDVISISRGDVYGHFTDLITRLEDRYDDLAVELGVKKSEITVGYLRRVSRGTARLIPIYESREYDDEDDPERVT